MATHSTKHIPGATGPTVAILTTSFPRFEGDNAGRFVYNFARELNLSGCSIRVIAPHDSAVVKNLHPFPVDHFKYFLPDSFQSLAYGAGMASRIKANVFRIFQIPFLLFSFFLSALKSTPHSQILHAYWTPAGLVAIAVKFFRKIPVVINLWGSDILFTKWPLIWPLLAWLFNRADSIICESQHFGDQLIEKGISEHLITILPNGIDLDQFKLIDKKLARKQLELPTDRPIILTIGNLSKRKGHEYLLTALPKILETYSNIQTVIVGEGEYRLSTELAIRKLNLESHVLLAGFQKGETIPLWLNAADIFVLPSLLEGTPNILLEAMACGLPIVSTAVGGIGSVIENGQNGLLIPTRSDKDIATAVISLLEDSAYRKRLGSTARETLCSQYGNWEQQASKLKTLYSRIISETSV